MVCPYCNSNHGEHLCNLCNGHLEYQLQQPNGIGVLLQVLEHMNLLPWLEQYTRANTEHWEDTNTNMGRFFANNRVNSDSFNGTNLKCLMMRIKSEAISRGIINRIIA